MRPSLIAFFSFSVLRRRGAATMVASTIWPDMARTPPQKPRDFFRGVQSTEAPPMSTVRRLPKHYRAMRHDLISAHFVNCPLRLGRQNMVKV
jgi:hypothetical protein